MKKLIASALAITMMLSMSMTAFATGSVDTSKVVTMLPGIVTESTTQVATVSTEVTVAAPATYVETTKVTSAVAADGTAVEATIAPVAEETVTSVVNTVKEQIKDVASLATTFIGGEKGQALAAASKASNVTIKTEVKTVVEVTVAGASASNPVTLRIDVPGVTTSSYIMLLHQRTDGAWENIPVTVGDGYVMGTFTSLSPIAVVELTADGVTSPQTGEEIPYAFMIYALVAVCALGTVAYKKVKFN